jgi:hypothetical protein
MLLSFSLFGLPEIVSGCKVKQTTAIKYCKSDQIKVTMLKHTRQNRFWYRSVADRPVYSAPAHTELLFISPPRRSDVCSASHQGGMRLNGLDRHWQIG